jgi:pilus assembly protein Flp/PilA
VGKVGIGLSRQRLLQIHLERRISPMLKYYIKTTEALKGLRDDRAGVVSFEYVIVAACVVGAVIAAFGTGSTGAIKVALETVITKIVDAVKAVTVT